MDRSEVLADVSGIYMITQSSGSQKVVPAALYTNLNANQRNLACYHTEFVSPDQRPRLCDTGRFQEWPTGVCPGRLPGGVYRRDGQIPEAQCRAVRARHDALHAEVRS